MRLLRRVRRPSPAMVVAMAALVMASTGSAIAAVNFAKRAGKVDGFSAVGPRTSNSKAAGKLVATRRSGSSNAGKIPNKFLGQVPDATTFGRFSEVNDNQAGAIQALHVSRLGALTEACNDQAGGAGTEDPTTTVTFVNNTPSPVNLARTVGGQNANVSGLAPGTQHAFTINGSNTFEIQAEFAGVDVIYRGQVRQDGRGTPAGTCLVTGTAETFEP
jgi:hypothetical protein